MTAAERTRQYRERRLAEIEKMPKIPCECGCGALIAPINKQLKPARYAHGHNPDGEATRFQKGNDPTAAIAARRAKGIGSGPGHHNWHGGEWRVPGGYVRCTITPEQGAIWPTALCHGNSWSIQRTHMVWNLAHPDDLVRRGDEVHHLNRVRDDDRIENLLKMTKAEHIKLHVDSGDRKRPRPAGRTACRKGHPYAKYRRRSANGSVWCTECARLKQAAYRERDRSTQPTD